MNLRNHVCWLLLLLLASTGLPGCGANPSAVNGTSSGLKAGQESQPRSENVAFEEAFHEWRSLVGQLHQLDIDYKTATESNRSKLEKRYEQLVREGTRLQQNAVDAAVFAYVKYPEENEELANFLVAIAHLLVQTEEYEEAVRLTQTLTKAGINGQGIANAGGLAAFFVGEFEIAEELFQAADKNRELNKEGRTNLARIDYYKEAWAREKKLRTAERMAGDLPRVLLRTTQGEIELELFENEAPNTVANFIFLVDRKFYDGLEFYDVVAGYMAQAGCPNGDGTGGPGYTIPCECYQPNHRLHFRGSLSMAHEGPNTGGSQFRLLFVPTQGLDGKHTVFGRIARGIEVLAKLQRRRPLDPTTREVNPFRAAELPKADKILEAKVIRKRNHDYVPLVIPLPNVQQPAAPTEPAGTPEDQTASEGQTEDSATSEAK